MLAAYTEGAAAALAVTAGRLLERSARVRIVAGGADDAIRRAVEPSERLVVVDTVTEVLPAVERALGSPSSGDGVDA